jgi:hypothetical protein
MRHPCRFRLMKDPTLTRISHKGIEKGCLFWHKFFSEKKICQEQETA